MVFFCHVLLARVPPRCVSLCRSPEMIFHGHPWLLKVVRPGSPLNEEPRPTLLYIGNHYCLHVLDYSGNHYHDYFDDLGTYMIRWQSSLYWSLRLCWQSGLHGLIKFTSPSKYPLLSLWLVFRWIWKEKMPKRSFVSQRPSLLLWLSYQQYTAQELRWPNILAFNDNDHDYHAHHRRPSHSQAWNMHKNAKKSRALRPILIPFWTRANIL